MSRGWKIFLSTVLAVFVFGVGFVAYASWSLLDGNENVQVVSAIPAEADRPILDSKPKVPVPTKVSDNVKNPSLTTPVTDLGVKYVLLLGVDARNDKLTGRSDAMLVAKVDRKNDRVDILSIPRDSYVEINGTGKYDKITHAYAFGGIKGATKTVEDLLNIKIDNFAVFNFTSFLGIIDHLGGIEINVPFAFTEQDSHDKQGAVSFKPGKQVLDGEHALAYARMRHQDPKGDLGRGARQQEVVSAVFAKLSEIRSPAQLVSLYSDLKTSIATNVSVTEIPEYMGYLGSFGSVHTYQLGGEDTRIDHIYYYKLNQSSVDKVREAFKEGADAL